MKCEVAGAALPARTLRSRATYSRGPAASGSSETGVARAPPLQGGARAQWCSGATANPASHQRRVLCCAAASQQKLAPFAKPCRALTAAGAVRAVLLAARIAKSRHATSRSGQVKSRNSPTFGGRTPNASVTVSLFLKLLLGKHVSGVKVPPSQRWATTLRQRLLRASSRRLRYAPKSRDATRALHLRAPSSGVPEQSPAFQRQASLHPPIGSARSCSAPRSRSNQTGSSHKKARHTHPQWCLCDRAAHQVVCTVKGTPVTFDRRRVKHR